MRNALLALALVSAPALAQAPSNVRVNSGTYQVDSAHTQVVFTLLHLGTSLYTGQFTQPTGTLTIDVGNPAKDKVDITFPIAKVSTTVPALDAHLQKPEFFDAAKFPEGHFVSTKVPIKGTTATITGDLTLRGVTKPVILATRFVGAGVNPMSKKTNVGFTATTTVKRSDFGVSYALPMVGDEVKLTINAAFVAE
ncbi:YceI family protein [Sphingomonas bacterium]|uniref:YceI family protein n=1 Tax=Sphingomonas bacterium TaxID=1895847 RepID=UPI0015767ED9|nr:YceI family protein [Sphingomonas bacterium]